MGFLAMTRELVRVFVKNDESNINVDVVNENDQMKVISFDPMLVATLKDIAKGKLIKNVNEPTNISSSKGNTDLKEKYRTNKKEKSPEQINLEIMTKKLKGEMDEKEIGGN